MPVKGVIVAAGYGSRLLPITRVVPKELLPLVDRPAIDFIVDEFVQAGITDILLITSRRKRALEDWFDRDPEIEAVFTADGARHKLERARPPGVTAYSVRQARMGGTGDALRLARSFAGADPVVVAYPDDLFEGPNVSAQLIAAWAETGASVLVAQDLSGHDVSRYGVLDATREGDWLRVRGIVEKPAPGTEPSSWVTYGRYLYTPAFFERLEVHAAEHAKTGEGGEFYPMGAMEDMARSGQLVSAVLAGERRDTGTTLGYVKAFIEEALRREDLRHDLIVWLEDRLG